MKRSSPILRALARIYERSHAGETGLGIKDVQPTFDNVREEFENANGRALEGDSYELAMEDLLTADGNVLRLQWDSQRFKTRIEKVRISPTEEREFYNWIGAESPTARREKWAALFREAATWSVPERWQKSWAEFCQRRAVNALRWTAMRPFQLVRPDRALPLLEITKRLLAWEGERLIRYASYELTGKSKHLETWQGSLETLLAEATDGAVRDFESHGLLPMPRVVVFHGPLRFWDGAHLALDAVLFADAGSLSGEDISRMSRVETTAARCLILENKAPFFEIARLQSGTLLVWSSFPTSATVLLLILLHDANPSLEFFHHGDTDAAGYDILRDLRQQTGIPIHSHYMHYTEDAASVELTNDERARLARLLKDPRMSAEHTDIAALLASGRKGNFEQERHREPPLAEWPFFPTTTFKSWTGVTAA